MFKVKFRTALGLPYVLSIVLMLVALLLFWDSTQNNLSQMQEHKVLRAFEKTVIETLENSLVPTFNSSIALSNKIKPFIDDKLDHESIEDLLINDSFSILKDIPSADLVGYQDISGNFFALKTNIYQDSPLLVSKNTKTGNLEIRARADYSSPLVAQIEDWNLDLINSLNNVPGRKFKFNNVIWTQAKTILEDTDSPSIMALAPWFDANGKQVGVSFIALNLSSLRDSLANRLLKNVRVYILDSSNNLLLSTKVSEIEAPIHQQVLEPSIKNFLQDHSFSHIDKVFKQMDFVPTNSDALLGTNGQNASQTESFETLSFNYKLENQLDWRIFIAVPSDFFISIDKQKNASLYTLIMIATATALFGIAIIRKLIAPISEIATATRQLAQGQLDSEINLKSSFILETDSLINNVNHMSRQIAASFQATRYSLYHDNLTGLLNLNGFKESFYDMQEEDDKLWNLALLSIKNFRLVNGSFGRGVGDIIIQSVASRLRHTIPDNSLLVRIEGVDFAVLVKTNSKDRFCELVNYLYQVISEPYKLEGEEIMIKSSIGFVAAEKDMKSYGGLDKALRKASIALGYAKASETGMKGFTEDMMKNIVEQSNMENELYRASHANEGLLALYQPVIDLQDQNKLHGAEALLRWKSEKRGVISPDVFIGIAEKSNLILSLDRWILNNVCENISVLSNKNPASKLNMHVNLSTRQILQTDLVSNIENIVRKYDANPSLLTLEVTESVLIDMNEDIVNNLRDLRNLGIKIALDDFGTGYSSLSYLQKVEFDSFKIDKTFIQNVTESKKNQSIVRAVLAMADGIGAEVIAEGVETKCQADWLRQEGCGYAQGFYYAKPLEFERLLANSP